MKKQNSHKKLFKYFNYINYNIIGSSTNRTRKSVISLFISCVRTSFKNHVEVLVAMFIE